MNASNPVAWREERIKLRRQASCGTSWGQVEQVALTDVSRQGCGVTTTRIVLQPGDSVIIRAAGLLGASGVVRWVDGLRLGVEFDEHLADRVLHSLQRAGAAATIIAPGQATFGEAPYPHHPG